MVSEIFYNVRCYECLSRTRLARGVDEAEQSRGEKSRAALREEQRPQQKLRPNQKQKQTQIHKQTRDAEEQKPAEFRPINVK